jgi:FAS-associated factor 2
VWVLVSHVARDMADVGMSMDEKVATLASISGNEDLEFCRQLLEAHGNCLETAVNVAIGAVPADGGGTQNAGTPPMMRAAAQRPGQGVVHQNQLLGLLLAPVKLGLGLVHGVLGLATRVVTGVLAAVLPPALAARFRALPYTGHGDVDDPVVAALEFRREFNAVAGEDLVGANRAGPGPGPAFLETGHREALRLAQTQLKFLFVYLHSRDSGASADVFCRDVLAHPDFSDYVNAKFVCWAGDVARRDARALAAAVRANSFPYVALLQSVDGRASLVMAREGQTTAEDLMHMLDAAAEAHAAPLTNARRARVDVVHARSLRDEQDAAFAESLEADARREAAAAAQADKERETRELGARVLAEEAEALAFAARREKEKERVVELRRLEKARSMKPEPVVGTECTCKVAVKFPDGQRVERRFLTGDTVRDVFDFVDSTDASAVGVAYSLVSNFPKRVFSRPDDAEVSLGEGGLAPQAVLMYRLDDE